MTAPVPARISIRSTRQEAVRHESRTHRSNWVHRISHTRGLQAHGHEVTALVRDDAQADTVTAHGATPALVDLYDRPAVVRPLTPGGRRHPHRQSWDETSADLDSAVVDAAIEAFDGTGKPYLHISGVWVYGDNTAISEDSPFKAPPWWHGRSQSSTGCSTPQTCAAW